MEKCFICGNNKFEFLLEKNNCKLMTCKKCGLNFISPQPTDKELQKLYSLDGNYSLSNKSFDKNIPREGNPRINFLVKNRKKTILDIGCSSGNFVYEAKYYGMDAIGIDLDPDSIKLGKEMGLNLYHSTLENMKFKDKSFDAINMGDIIEHVKDPLKFIQEAKRILKKDGILIISTPNTNSLFAKITKSLYKTFGIMWSHPTPPYHLFDFSDKNLSIFLEENGFDIYKIEYSKIPLAYSIYHTGYFNNLRNFIKKKEWKEFIKLLKKFDLTKTVKQTFTFIVYSFSFLIDYLIDRGGNEMLLYVKRR